MAFSLVFYRKGSRGVTSPTRPFRTDGLARWLDSYSGPAGRPSRRTPTMNLTHLVSNGCIDGTWIILRNVFTGRQGRRTSSFSLLNIFYFITFYWSFKMDCFTSLIFALSWVCWMTEESSLQDGVCVWCMPVYMLVCECLDLVDSSCKRHWMPLFISDTIWAQPAIPTDILWIQSSILLFLQYMDASLKDKLQDGCPPNSPLN